MICCRKCSNYSNYLSRHFDFNNRSDCFDPFLAASLFFSPFSLKFDLFSRCLNVFILHHCYSKRLHFLRLFVEALLADLVRQMDKISNHISSLCCLKLTCYAGRLRMTLYLFTKENLWWRPWLSDCIFVWLLLVIRLNMDESTVGRSLVLHLLLLSHLWLSLRQLWLVL